MAGLTPEEIAEQAKAAAAVATDAAERAQALADQAVLLADGAGAAAAATTGIDPFVFRLAIFVLAIFVGYFVVWAGNAGTAHPLDGGDECHLIGDRCRRITGDRRRRCCIGKRGCNRARFCCPHSGIG